MLTVHLSNLVFHAFHGVYEAERLIGSNYEVDVTVKYDEADRQLDDLNNIVNYEVIFEIVRKRMSIPTPLLEEVTEAIVRKIKHQYRQLSEIAVTIYKLQPPIAGLQGKVGVTLHKIFEE
jgi:7,8-dihydroneopterin aldolase/epimerase/oxygenase